MADTNISALLYLSSPALPIGAFAYSQGLEKAIDLGWVRDADSLSEWTQGVLKHSLCQLDVPVLLRLRKAIDKEDQEAIVYWNQFLLANRETAELHQEDINLGKSLCRLLLTQDRFQLDGSTLPKNCSFVCAYAYASNELNIEPELAAQGLLWSWLENQITVSCKAIPLGQSDGQKVLLAALPQLSGLVDRASALEDDELGGSLPGMAMVSALHETQYSRLFRS